MYSGHCAMAILDQHFVTPCGIACPPSLFLVSVNPFLPTARAVHEHSEGEQQGCYQVLQRCHQQKTIKGNWEYNTYSETCPCDHLSLKTTWSCPNSNRNSFSPPLKTTSIQRPPFFFLPTCGRLIQVSP